MMYFGVALLIAAAILFYFTRCVRSTFVVLLCSLIAVIWQIGMLRLLGLGLDPFSVLVPFLIFAIGVSHGAQKMNGIQQDVGRGTVHARRGALHVPPPVRRGRDGAVERRGRLRRAAADPDPGDPRTGDRRDHRRRACCCSPTSCCCR